MESNDIVDKWGISMAIVVGIFLVFSLIYNFQHPLQKGTCYKQDFCVLYNGTMIHDVSDINSENYQIVMEDARNGKK